MNLLEIKDQSARASSGDVRPSLVFQNEEKYQKEENNWTQQLEQLVG